MNNIKVFILLAAMTALFGVVGGAIGGKGGMLIALAIAAVMNFVMYEIYHNLCSLSRRLLSRETVFHPLGFTVYLHTVSPE